MYIGGNFIRFQSEINGDLIGGSQELVFSGICRQDIIWGSRWLTINGPVEGTIRGFAQTIDINAPVGRNLMAMGQIITIGPSTEITKDAILFGADVSFEGHVYNSLYIKAGKTTIGGTIGGDIDVETDQLEILPNTVIEGDLIYKSPDKVKIEESVLIKGQTRWTKAEEKIEHKKYQAFGPITFMLKMYLLLNVIYSLIIFIITLILGNTALIPLIFLTLIVSGMVVIRLNKKTAERALSVMKERFFVSLGLGVVLILLFPLAAFLAILTIIGIPIGLIIVFTFGIFCFTGAIYTAQFIGNYIGHFLNIDKHPLSFLCLAIGVVVLAGLILIPFIGWIVALFTLTVGLGALVLSLERFKGKTIKIPKSNP